MPVMDGLEATRQIRQYEKENAVKPALILALTGLTAEEDHEKARESGFDKFLEKPVRLKDLGVILDEWEARNATEEKEEK